MFAEPKPSQKKTTAAKEAPAPKAVTTKVTPKKKAAPAKKAATNKVAATKTTATPEKAAASQSSATAKAPARKQAPVTKKAVKQTPAVTTVTKTLAPAKKAKPAAAKAKLTRITARVDVGFGNQLYIRGEGAGLSWDKGVLLENKSAYEWVFETAKANSKIEYKFLINDELWAEGLNQVALGGAASSSTPNFNW
jgi:ATP/maltotriose-dependent transcriptional regulator MalT